MRRRVTRRTTGRTPRAPGTGRSPAGRVVVLLVGALLALVPAGSAGAHDPLVGSEPGDGAVLDAAPSQVVLTFAAEQLSVGAAVVVTGPDGASWSLGDPAVTGTTVSQALLPGLPSGSYSVEWRSVSGDGHPVDGTLTFSLEAPDPAGGAPPEETTAPSTVSPGASASPDLTPSAAPTVLPDAAAAGDDAAGSGVPFVWPVVVLLALAAVTVAVRRRAQP